MIIIQTPKFIIDTWQPTLDNLATPKKITEIYEFFARAYGLRNLKNSHYQNSSTAFSN